MSLKELNLAPVANAGALLTLQHPGDGTELKGADGKPITISLLGKDSDTFTKADNILSNTRVEAAKRQAKFSAAQFKEQNCGLYAYAVTGWSGIPKCWIEGGEDEAPATFTFEAAKMLFLNQGWVFEQAKDFVDNRANFLKAA